MSDQVESPNESKVLSFMSPPGVLIVFSAVFLTSFTPTIEIVMQEESNINKTLANSCFVKFQYVSL